MDGGTPLFEEEEVPMKFFAPDGQLKGPTWLWVIVLVALFVLASIDLGWFAQ